MLGSSSLNYCLSTNERKRRYQVDEEGSGVDEPNRNKRCGDLFERFSICLFK
jgi:hypothetical protein